MFKRWYDKDAALSLTVSLIQNAGIEEREECAKFIIEECQKHDVLLEHGFWENIKYQLKRWYDHEKILFEAFEYLRISPVDVKKDIITKVLELLQNSKVSNS